MAAIDFPASPANGATFTPATGISYRFQSTPSPGLWMVVNGPVDTVIASDTPPANPAPNQLWFNASLAMLYVYYDDSSSQQWVPAMPLPAPIPAVLPIARSKVTRFTANGTFTPDINCIYGFAEAKGGGGGGCTLASNAAYIHSGGGGGEGARGIKYFVRADVAPSQAIIVGAGGATGTAGGATSMGALLSAGGGSAALSGFAAMGGAGGTAVTGDIAIPGAAGSNGMLTTGTGWAAGGVGGGTGGGLGNVWTSSAGAGGPGGNAVANSGGGGGGPSCHTITSTFNGGTGGSGYLTVVEYLKA